MVMSDAWDCVVVGPGRVVFRRRFTWRGFAAAVLVLHDGTARALRIPRTHNVPGFPMASPGRTSWRA